MTFTYRLRFAFAHQSINEMNLREYLAQPVLRLNEQRGSAFAERRAEDAFRRPHSLSDVPGFQID